MVVGIWYFSANGAEKIYFKVPTFVLPNRKYFIAAALWPT
jgi:hypothetical protein